MNTFKRALIIASTLAFAAIDSIQCEARAEESKPDFKQLIVKHEPAFSSFTQTEQLRIESNGQCWYRAEDRPARINLPALSGAFIGHKLSPDHIERLNKLLKDTEWLTAKGGDGRATHTDADTTTLTLNRNGESISVACHGKRPVPYAALLHELVGLILQERRIYLHDYVSGQAGTEAWQEIGREMQALRGGPFSKPAYNFDYRRYLPIAQRIIRDFYGEQDDELIPAVQLVAQLKTDSELPFLQRMAHDRSMKLREEVARALRQIHDNESLPVLASMAAGAPSNSDIDFELIQWGDDAVPEIVKLIAMSTGPTFDNREHVLGEDMIRAYLDHLVQIKQPIDPRVVAAVRTALDGADPRKSVRTTYHTEFLEKFAANSESGRRK